jgi:hyperosmotically inducible protein
MNLVRSGWHEDRIARRQLREPSSDDRPTIAWKGSVMPKHIRLALTALGLSVLLASAGLAAQSQAKSTIEDIRTELLQLPYYGVFDFMAFSYNKGTVTLMGYAYHLGLKSDAERAVKRASGVDTVVDKIEELPPSSNDDGLRWKIYYAIYRDPFLSRYAPGGGMLWGHRHAFGGAFSPLGPGLYPGMEPAGDYPIHIIVKNMRVTLLGVVDNDGDRTIAEMKARQVPGSFEVKNELMVEKPSNKS